MSTEVIARLQPSAARRFIAVGMLIGLGALLIYVALATPPQSLALRALLLGLGAGAIYIADRVRQATALAIELTEEGLRDTRGRSLARIEDMVAVERGAFAFKPSNGFAVRLAQPAAAVWAPGLWWRIGRRVGVGGVTAQAQGKVMAELLAMRLKK